MFSTQLVKPHTPALYLNAGTDIILCDKVRYLGITVDDKLHFQFTCAVSFNNSLLTDVYCEKLCMTKFQASF